MREIDRLLSIPRADYSVLGRRSVRGVTDRFARRRSTPSVLESQAGFLVAFRDVMNAGTNHLGDQRGAVGLIECGGGKTLALQFAMMDAIALGAGAPLLITKAALVRALRAEREKWAPVFRLPRMPEVDALGEGPACGIMTYGKLSHSTGEDALATHAPDAIFLDEAHRLGLGGRRKKLWRYVRRFRGVPVSAVTGSLTNASLHDFVALLAICLRDWTPLPIRMDILDQWASVVDLRGEPDREARRALLPMMPGFRGVQVIDDPERFQEAARDAVRARITETKGVYLHSEGLADSSLSLKVIGPRATRPVMTALRTLHTEWTLPDGTELVDHLEFHAAAATLRLGFFRRWDPDTYDVDWFEARRAWASCARAHVNYAGFDTLGQVSEAAEEGRLRSDALDTWDEWQRLDGSPGARPTRQTIFLDEKATIRDTVAGWMQELSDPSRGVVWYRSKAVGDALGSWMPVFPSGITPPTSGPCAVGIGHAEGWNGQAFNEALVLEVPTSGRLFEQLVSRHHRRGQDRDVCFSLIGGAETQHRVTKAARYAATTAGMTQRALTADWL